jgi:cysteinyl-tRNA synthetase
VPLKLYNTRTRTVEKFEPLREGEVRIYVCGLTPSAQAHLGHARSFLFFDVLRRYLTHRGYRVTYVQNVTDIDDRSIKAGIETGQDYHAIVEYFYAEFKESMRRLGVLEYDFEPYATKYIGEIQQMIRELAQSGHAYVSRDGVYYRVSTFASYGRLANRNVADLEAGARIEVDENKEDPLDFALWKFAKPGEPRWPFEPYGDGRPGWHIECSAMARALLDPPGVGFDIHGGGADLIFPHHENEIAQSEPLMAQPPMANFWVHGGLLLFDNRKMAKSLGNFEPLSDLLLRHDPQAIRWLFLQTGYRKVMNFTEDSIAAAALGLSRIKAAYRSLYRPERNGQNTVFRSPSSFDCAQDDVTPLRINRVEGRSIDEKLGAALDDDMNTATALAVLFEFVADLPDPDADPTRAAAALDALDYWLPVLGIEPNARWVTEPAAELPPDFTQRLQSALSINLDGMTPPEAVERVVTLRAQARLEKNWGESDRLRDVLAQCGVELKDGKEGTTWRIASS